jgi:glycosyltransferase involved in cell wall biosynthesis
MHPQPPVAPHVLIDATAIPADRGGVGRYLVHLIPALALIGANLTIACAPRDAVLFRDAAPGSAVEAVPSAGRSRAARMLWEQVGLPRLARRAGADVIFSPHYTMPHGAGLPVVVTLHDATFFSHPELHSRLKGMFFRWWTRRALAAAAACLVPSHATEDELLRWVKPRTNRMTVAYHGVDTATFHAPSAEEVATATRRVGAARWIAFLGTLEPRKNVSSLVRAFAMLKHEPDLRLVLAGGRGWDAEVDAVIEQSSARDRIDSLGFVPDAELAGLLGGSAAFAYPSKGEGFGLPVLEAMACGAVVVTTPILALPEVGGDVALYAQPDPGSLAEVLKTALDAKSRPRRAAGIERAATFSWEASARTHLEVFTAAATAGV